jgi:tRNA pseudouridine38-40 synthase
MPPEFHARRSAVAKTYRYHIYRGAICSPFQARYVYHHPYPLDESRMIQAAALVEGEHDFTSFAAVDPEKRKEALAADQETLPANAGLQPNNVRTIFLSQWQRHGDELIYTVGGNGFLHHMVRNLVGTFLMVGKGSLSAADVRRILELRDRSAAAATAPAGGLFLVSVEY